ncbi:YraN family protein [Legionella jordanis]|uniref:UPF0102 protein Ljor_2195 n=1 Tax=Legionella jordanis TaxID=456 RepID=A0A0W0VCL6_9GAMM|nr:YraN family protein [Legionella jordanis]KTD17889.1 hypothetical protein Ljor_2195 [Legionella jordanis]RMX02412.1 YraN family protein [Legionella jordanis]VEH14020.1 putative endonuclease distantly related to archaeal Holliday junction resolvase [Legionella jordanis]HAT8713859.1 YraN family protein [Legionella jordanis]
MSRQLGTAAEQRAKNYLLAQGLKWIGSNYRCRWGEIDLIMSEGSCLIFVEVRSRSSLSFGGAAASIGWAKKQKLLKAASHYLLVHPNHSKQPSRFDVLSLDGSETINWIRNAFGLDF